MASSSIINIVMVLFLVLFQAKISSSTILLKHHHNNNNYYKTPVYRANQSSCNLYVGTWVQDSSYPTYQSSSCPVIDPEFNCQMYGRPDSEYQKYRWKPVNCEFPRFNGVEFLERMRGKHVMFVGDSLGRNQWESLICMVYASASRSETQFVRSDPLSTFKFLDYGVSLSFYKAPYLVDIDNIEGKRILRLDDISSNANVWKNVDVLSFNSGHWWIHKGGLQGWDYMEIGKTYYQDMDRLAAFERGMETWARWVDSNIDRTRTRVFFQAISPTHYNPTDWSVGPVSRAVGSVSSNCYGETMPLSGGMYLGPYPDQMNVVNEVMRQIKFPVYLLNITALSELRKDGHPSIFSGDLSPGQRANPDRSADCSHWCLPGLPDTWNQLFYTLMFY